MNVQEVCNKYGINDVLTYAAYEERGFKYNVSPLGYSPKTTFFSDLSIAEWFGVESINDTYNRVCKEWINNVEYFTEFVMSLNHKSWEWYARDNEGLSKLYAELYYKAYDLGMNHYHTEDRNYFWNTLD